LTFKRAEQRKLKTSSRSPLDGDEASHGDQQ
jgi:hypothetical protein